MPSTIAPTRLNPAPASCLRLCASARHKSAHDVHLRSIQAVGERAAHEPDAHTQEDLPAHLAH